MLLLLLHRKYQVALHAPNTLPGTCTPVEETVYIEPLQSGF